jgi:HlyD family secretion protein
MNQDSSRIRVTLRRSVKWVLLAAVIALAAYRVKFAPLPVLAAEARMEPIAAEVMGTGTLEARVKTTISPRIQEQLAEVLVDQNDTVEKGQLLAVLDDSELKRQAEVTEAAGAAAEASLERAKADRARAMAVARQAELSHERVAGLLETQVASRDQWDKAVEALQVAEAELKRGQAAVAEAEGQLLTAQKTLAYHRERLGYTRIFSPFDGLVVRRDRDPGGVVVPGSSILYLISTNELWISAWVDETAAAGLAPGQPARVVFRSHPNHEYPGQVTRLGRETDRETREFLVDVRVQKLPPNWTVGQRAEVFIQTSHKEAALAIPERFVQWREGRPGVFVDEGGTARWRSVKLGLRGGAKVEMTEGLTAGERVVAPIQARQAPLAEGRRVRPQ